MRRTAGREGYLESCCGHLGKEIMNVVTDHKEMGTDGRSGSMFVIEALLYDLVVWERSLL